MLQLQTEETKRNASQPFVFFCPHFPQTLCLPTCPAVISLHILILLITLAKHCFKHFPHNHIDYPTKYSFINYLYFSAQLLWRATNLHPRSQFCICFCICIFHFSFFWLLQLWRATNLRFASLLPILTPARPDSCRYCPKQNSALLVISLLHSIICKKRANSGFVLNAQF